MPELSELFAAATAAEQRGMGVEYEAEMAAASFPFRLDAFQMQAMRALCEKKNVILSAPTGSGKTAVGEMAILLGLARGLRVFYTTPLKALSNQKFADFKRQFGDDRVGLLTGDVNVNRDADIVVCTTEVYRNMLYADGPAGGGRVGSTDKITDDVFAVIFDEFHYINDASRGTTWEESVVNSPSHILLVALSATMANTGEVRDWFVDVQGPTELVETDYRPVPLKFSFCQREGVLPLFHVDDRGIEKRRRRTRRGGKEVDEKPKMHPKLLASVFGDGAKSDRRRNGRNSGRKTDAGGRDGAGGKTDFDSLMRDYERAETSQSRRGGMPRSSYRERMSTVPSYPFVVRALRRRDMLPAIFFIFSRKGCDEAASAAASERESLVSEEEEEEIRRRVETFTSEHPGLVNEDRIQLALKGIASHHAGLLPLWKAFVEGLFQDGLVKVVMATETLAAGINMPARTTVISCLSKRRGDEGIVRLSTSEVLQMAGRAGRRGKDTIGYSVIMQSPYEGPIEAYRTVTSKVDALRSHFTPSYGMVINLLQTRSLEDARSLVERSFGAFLRRKADQVAAAALVGKQPSAEEALEAAKHLENELAALRAVSGEAEGIVGEMDKSLLLGYVKAMERVKAERRALGYVVRQSRETDVQLIEDALTFAAPGTRLLLRGARPAGTPSTGSVRRQKRRVLAAAMGEAGRGEGIDAVRAFYLDDEEGDIELEGLDDVQDTPGDGRDLVECVLLDIGPDFGVQILFAALGVDGLLHFFTHEHVERLFLDEGDEVFDLEAHAPDWRDFEFPQRSEWTCIGLNQYVSPVPEEIAPLSTAVARLAPQQSDVVFDADHDSSGSVGAPAVDEKTFHPEVHAQRERLGYAKSLVRDHPLHGTPDLARALRARAAMAKIGSELKEREQGSGGGKRARRRTRRRGAGGSSDEGEGGEGQNPDASGASAAGAASTAYNEDVFTNFMNIVRVAQHYGFLDEDNCVTAIGEVAAKVRSENELWASLVLMEPALEEASPVHLAAVVGSIMSEGVRANAYMAWQPSEESMALIQDLQPMRTRLLAIQEESNVDFAVGLDVDHVGLVEAWASGDSWVDILSSTSLQEGDVCRILRRVLDLLRQVPHLPFVSDGVKLNAKRAVTLFDRSPVVDSQTYVVRKSEKVGIEEAVPDRSPAM